MVESSPVIFVLSAVCYKGLFFLRFTQKEHPQTAAKQFGTTLIIEN